MSEVQTQTTLRREKRRLRRSLGFRQRRRLTNRVCANLIASSWLRRCRRVAFFSALQRDGEIDLSKALLCAQRRKKRCFLPVLLKAWRPPRLYFREYRAQTRLAQDSFGINYPTSGKLWRGVNLDLILTPLTVFDSHGRRIGMGGGYYDRAFRRRRARTRMLGCAFALQQSNNIPEQSWDVLLDDVVSELGFVSQCSLE